MALWRDPLDELIDELDRAVPPAPATDNDLFDLVLMQMWATTVLYGSDEDRARMGSQPWYHEFMAQLERFNARRRQVTGTHDRSRAETPVRMGRGAASPHVLASQRAEEDRELP